MLVILFETVRNYKNCALSVGGVCEPPTCLHVFISKISVEFGNGCYVH